MTLSMLKLAESTMTPIGTLQKHGVKSYTRCRKISAPMFTLPIRTQTQTTLTGCCENI